MCPGVITVIRPIADMAYHQLNPFITPLTQVKLVCDNQDIISSISRSSYCTNAAAVEVNIIMIHVG